MKNKYLYIFLLLNLFKEAKSLSKKDFISYFKEIGPAIGATSLLLAFNAIPKIRFYENNKKFKKVENLYTDIKKLNNRNKSEFNSKLNSLYKIIETINPQIMSS